MNVFGKAGEKETMISNGKLINAIDADVEIYNISFYGPDRGNGITYNVTFLNSEGKNVGNYTRVIKGSTDQLNHDVEPKYFKKGEGPNFGIGGGTIIIKANLSQDGSYYDGCFNVGLSWRMNVTYKK